MVFILLKHFTKKTSDMLEKKKYYKTKWNSRDEN